MPELYEVIAKYGAFKLQHSVQIFEHLGVIDML
jgi:hypothetical protein